MTDLRLTPARILGALLAVLSLWVLHMFLEAILAACVIATASWPLYARFAARLPRGTVRAAAPVLFTSALTVFVLAPLVFACWALLTEAHALLVGLAAADRAGIGVPAWLAEAPVVGPWLAARWQPGALGLLTQHATPQAVLGWAQSLGEFTMRHLLTIVFTILLLCFLYRQGAALAGALAGALRRLVGGGADRYMEVASRAVRSSVHSMLAVGLFDAVMTAGAYTAAGAPRALVWGAITGALATVPFLGYLAVSALVLQLALQGAASPALASLLLGCAVLLCGDKLLRPFVAREGVHLPFVWVLMACLGGFGMLGLAGLVVGPVVLSLAREMGEQRLHALSSAPSSAPGRRSAPCTPEGTPPSIHP
ncbi:AI-2E family transporter [Ramlibacter montanisoli]|uniref:AI-2E family transporter n=1 Tax=Ramlibacter montanisoli TaxID=2732512 RepID=A0A849K7M4_9BURK|nr:AI-2E family transporter [Ramlibacter montanisoli]NNU42057.1 AI-2E family transporter [Ramlibacter montanisoli]